MEKSAVVFSKVDETTFFDPPHFYWLELVLLLLISLCANKKGGSIKVVSLRFDVTTDEMSLLYLEQ